MDECEEADQFDTHFKYDLSPEQLAAASKKKYSISKQTWPSLNQLIIKSLEVSQETTERSKSLIDSDTVTYTKIPGALFNMNSSDLKKYHIKSCIIKNVLNGNLVHTGEPNLSSLQLELLSIIHEYRDLYFTRRTFSNAEQIRYIYCLHAINHTLKARLRVTDHNAMISDENDAPEECRDQGLVRPRVLVVVPFKNSALR